MAENYFLLFKTLPKGHHTITVEVIRVPLQTTQPVEHDLAKWGINVVDEFTSNMFKRFLEHNDIKDKPIPNSYPQLAGKIEAYFFLPHHALNILNQIMQQPVVQPIPFEMRQFA